MAVIAVLLLILSPALTSIRESARQVVCRSNVRQMGIGISLFAEEHRDLIPATANAPVGQLSGDPWQTMELRFEAVGNQPPVWDGLGHMYEDEFLPAPKIFYCPSHHGNHPFAEYAGEWSGGNGSIVGNFQYRGSGLSQRKTLSNPNPPVTAALSKMVPQTALVADGMRTQEDFNHRIGANVLRAGLSVDWWRDPGGTLIDGLPKDGQIPSPMGIQEAWYRLDSVEPN
jgi:hypothetical protein